MNKSSKIIADKYGEWEFSPEGIHSNFAGNYYFPSQEQEAIFFTALSKLPRSIIKFTRKIYFTSSNYNDYAETFTFNSKLFKGQIAIINLYPKIWRLPFEKFVAWIAHEIAHAYLKHELGYAHDIVKEKEADELASKWLGRKINNYIKLEKKLNIAER
jgi:hypothetical protein